MAVVPTPDVIRDLDDLLAEVRDCGLLGWLRIRLDQMADPPPIPPGMAASLASPRVVRNKPTTDSAPDRPPWTSTSSISAIGAGKKPRLGRPEKKRTVD